MDAATGTKSVQGQYQESCGSLQKHNAKQTHKPLLTATYAGHPIETLHSSTVLFSVTDSQLVMKHAHVLTDYNSTHVCIHTANLHKGQKPGEKLTKTAV